MSLVLSKDVDTMLSKKVDGLLTQIKNMPQVNCQEQHFFGPSLYVKQVTMPAGSVIVGKHHKMDHLCNMLTGKMIIVQADGSRQEFTAPVTFVAKPGRKVAYILETVVFQNIYATDETDIEKLESMFVETPALEQGK